MSKMGERMKTPEEIKKGLECCARETPYPCRGCPYEGTEGESWLCGKDKDVIAYIEQLECKAKPIPITCGECEYYGKSPMGSTLGWCRLDCKHRNAGFWCANADRRANK